MKKKLKKYIRSHVWQELRDAGIGKNRSRKFKVGDIYYDCAYHPCVCAVVNLKEDMLEGISLVDGCYPRCCSIMNCGPTKITMKQALFMKEKWPEIKKDSDAYMESIGWGPKKK